MSYGSFGTFCITFIRVVYENIHDVTFDNICRIANEFLNFLFCNRFRNDTTTFNKENAPTLELQSLIMHKRCEFDYNLGILY